MRAAATWRPPWWAGPHLTRLGAPRPYKQAPTSRPAPAPPPPPHFPARLLLQGQLEARTRPGSTAGQPPRSGSHTAIRPALLTLRPALKPSRPDTGQGHGLPPLCPQHMAILGHSWEGHLLPAAVVVEKSQLLQGGPMPHTWLSSKACR